MPSKLINLAGPIQIHETIRMLIHNLVNIKDETGKFLLELPDGRIIDTKGWNDWEWTHGIGLYGIYQYYNYTNDQSFLDIIETWFRDRFASGGTTKNINTMAVFLTLACVYEETRNESYLKHLDEWAEWAMNELPRTKYGGMQHITYNSINEGELWDDTLMMTVMPLAKIGMVLQRPHYIEEAKRQFLVHIQYLFDTKSGLFFHGWTFKDGGHNFARALWARGNSWLTIVIPEFLDLLDLPQNDPIRLHLINTMDAQCASLCPLQTSDGLWRTLLDVSELEGSYLESSATAGFAFGLLKGMRKGYIVGDEYERAALRAIHGVTENITANGELQKVSFGTAMGHDLKHYIDIERTSMPYGQAMGIMALVEFLKHGPQSC